MIAINTNGKMEYSYFCPTEYATKVDEWRKRFDGFILQHQETVIAEIYPKESKVNLFFSTIPSERYDFDNRICDTSFAAVSVNYNGDGKEDFKFFKSALLMYDPINKYRILGKDFDDEFKDQFFDEINSESVHYQNTYDLVASKLKKIQAKLDNEINNTVGIAPEVKENYCRILPIESDRTNYVAALENATQETDTDKIILLITSMSVNEEKIKKLFDTQDDTTVKALVYSTNAKTEQPSIEIKKKPLLFPTKVGIAVVTVGLIMASLLIWLMPSPSPKTDSTKLEADSIISVTQSENGCVNEIMKSEFLSLGTYTDGNLKLRISDTLLQMYNINDSLIQSFIFRLDSVRKIDE